MSANASAISENNEISQYKGYYFRDLRGPYILFSLFMYAFLFDPGGGIGIKYAISFLIAIYIILTIREQYINISSLLIELPIFFLFPILSSIIGIFNGADLSSMLGIITFPLTWIIYPLLIRLSPQGMISIFLGVMRFGALLFIILFLLLYILLFTQHVDLVAQISRMTYSLKIGYFGIDPELSNVLGGFPNVYFRWSLLLIPALMLSTMENSPRFYMLLLASILSFSAGLIIFGLAGLVVIAFLRAATRTGRLVALGFGIIAIIVLLSLPMGESVLGILGENIFGRLTMDSESTRIKVGHILSIIDILSANWVHVLFGTGAGTEFYSEGVKNFVTDVEVSHFNMIRQMGVLYFCLFSGYALFIILKLWATDAAGQRLAIGLMMLYIAAGTNPLLMSPIFLIPLIMGRAYVFRMSRGMEN